MAASLHFDNPDNWKRTNTVEDCREFIESQENHLNYLTEHNVLAIVKALLTSPPGMSTHEYHPRLVEFHADNFARAIRQIKPAFDLERYIGCCDTQDFKIMDRLQLIPFVQFLKASHPDNSTFPVHLFLQPWNNKPNQLSFLGNIIYNSDVFNFGDYPHTPLNLTLLKNQPDDNKELQNWRCKELFETLLKFVDYQEFTRIVYQMFQRAAVHTAITDVLVLGMTQIVVSDMWTPNVDNLLKALLQTLLMGSGNSSIVINAVWNWPGWEPHWKKNPKEVVFTVFSEVYNSAPEDQAKLTKILEVAHELKPNGLSELFSSHVSWPFLIDLSFLASRRDFLKLDKWLTDKIDESGDIFLKQLTTLIQKKMKQAAFNPNTSPGLPQETITTVLTVLNQKKTESQSIFATLNELTIICSDKGHSRPSHFGTPPVNENFYPGGSHLSHMMGTHQSQQHANLIREHLHNPNIGLPVLNARPSSLNLTGHGENLETITGNEDLISHQFDKAIQDEANVYFQTIYSSHGVTGVHEFMIKLKRCKTSNNLRDKEILFCVIKSLFDEFQYFKDYPSRELKVTAEVYGLLIKEGILVGQHLGYALSKILESLNEKGTNLNVFGAHAIEMFIDTLENYPLFCKNLVTLPGFQTIEQPGLREAVQNAFRACQARGIVGTPIAPKSTSKIVDPKAAVRANAGSSLSNVTNVDILISATEKETVQCKDPPEQVVDEVGFLINNLSISNIPAKVLDFRELINKYGNDFLFWFARYITIKRVSIESNFQNLYNTFLIELNNDVLDEMIKKETYRSITVLLRLENKVTASAYSDRQLLKNMGNWLGMITIAREKPICSCDLDLKSLLLEAYCKGPDELMYVVPFIAKIISSCTKSTIFDAKCAWINSILAVLAELYHRDGMKLNLTFEIEVLFKALQVEISQLEVSNVLKHAEAISALNPQMGAIRKYESAVVPAKPSSATPVPFYASTPMSVPPLSTPTPAADFIPYSGRTSAMANPNASGTSVASDEGPLPQKGSNSPEFVQAVYDFMQTYIKFPASPVLTQYPQIRRCLADTISETICENRNTIADKALKNSLAVTESLIRKDFALESKDSRMRSCARVMARATASCMMHITTKESLNNGLLNSMKNKCNAVVSNCVPQPELRTPELFKQVEVMVREVYESNIDTITNFVVKITSERAITDIDKRLEADYQARAVAKNENRPYVNAYGLELQERLPEVLRLDDNGISNDKVTQYMAQFDRAYQFKPLLAESEGPRVEPVAIPQVIVEVDKLVRDLGLYIKPITQLLASQVNIPGVTTIKAYHSIAAIKEIFSVFFNTPKTADTVVAMTTQVSDCFMQGYDPDSYGPLGVNRNLSGTGSQLNTRLKEIFLGYFSKLYNHMKPHDVHQLLTKIVMERSVSVRLKEWQSMDVIFKRCMIDSKSHDAMMANAINDGNVQEITYAQKLSKMFGTDSRVFAQYTSLYPLTITALKKYMTKGMVFGEMTKAVEPATTPIPDNFAFSVEQLSAKEKTLIINAKAAYNDNPSQMALKTEVIFREWLRICNLTEYHDDTQGLYQKIVQMLMYEGILISDDTLSDFFICLLDLSVDLSKRLEENLEKIMDPVVLRIRHHRHIDGLVKLVTILIRYSGTNGAASKLKVFMTFCATLTRVFVADYNANEKKFCTIPYHRILTMLFSQLMTNEPTLERYHTTICEAFAQLLFSIQPKLYPRICFVWIEMLGHKNVLHAFLAYGNESPDGMKRWSMYAQLLQVALKFVHPFIRNITMKNSTQHLFSGMVKLLLVILHDFPDLLCEYHFKFVDVIPTNCTQIKNIVLSAYPQAQILPDPFVTSLEQIEVLPDMHTDPKQFLKFEQYLPAGFLKQLDEFLENRSSIEVLSELPSMCKTFPPNHEFPGRYNTQFINALVVYLGKRAVESIKEKKLTITTQTIAHTSYMDVFQHLALSLDSEGRYLLFSALANNLRYPNSQTHYFCKAILFLFKEVGQQAVQEQLTRTLFERIICLRPHPWGLLVTFIELIRNTEYRFWEYDFVNCAPELKRLLRCVSNSTQIKGGSISVDVGSTTPSSNSVDKNSPAEGLVYN